ncbi:P22_AR N-terminal domain-containing protein [Singulisphaera sp. GP187]|uniref:phage antirepressor N-terminal domain-containing protein n=1 Tax=Singulisphaera sp. GP187 TaxID=1882752 RepID=UPI00092C1FC8|nr:phage antirepressor N-terminal domain-containing protein [Singulisphaera sp. GP187]SIO37758.1 P22_AR N-terminal domain-containing protein [Singulisphaera sp. GP187]
MKIHKCSDAVIQVVTRQFFGCDITAVQTSDGRIWVSLRSVCEALGIATQNQITKLRSSDYDWARAMMIIAHDASGRQQELAMIDLESLPMWLVTIKPSKVAIDAREKLKVFKKEAKAVLAAWFTGNTKPLFEIVSTDKHAEERLGRMQESVEELQAQVRLLGHEVKAVGLRNDSIEKRLTSTLFPSDKSSEYMTIKEYHDEYPFRDMAGRPFQEFMIPAIARSVSAFSRHINVPVRKREDDGRTINTYSFGVIHGWRLEQDKLNNELFQSYKKKRTKQYS